MRLGVVSYTNTTSGVGTVARDLVDNLPVDSYLSVRNVKGQEHWLERQIDGIPDAPTLNRYLDEYQPDILIAVETFFMREVYDLCRKRGVKTVLMVMHESYLEGKHDPDWYLCPTRIAWDRVGEPNKVYFDWPIDVRPFPFTQRTQARRFLHVMGYGSGARAAAGGFNRRQTREVYQGFCAVADPDATLTIHCQEDWKLEYGECDDPAVTFRLGTLPTPADVYAGFDVLIQPDAYAGYNRVLLEAKACGMPVLTTDAPPMNELVHDPDALIPCLPEWFDYRKRKANFGPICYRHVVTAEDVAAAIGRALRWDIPAKSARARACAEARAWNTDKRADFVRLLEMMSH
jgi:hypothetical protein